MVLFRRNCDPSLLLFYPWTLSLPTWRIALRTRPYSGVWRAEHFANRLSMPYDVCRQRCACLCQSAAWDVCAGPSEASRWRSLRHFGCFLDQLLDSHLLVNAKKSAILLRLTRVSRRPGSRAMSEKDPRAS